MFLPVNRQEMQQRGWNALDVVLVTGDAYVDSPFIGVAVIGRVLEAAGYRVGVISQPDTGGPAALEALPAPRLFWGITGGSIDSMVAHYTAQGRRRGDDDMTPGGRNDRRPDRACIAYTNWIRRFSPAPTSPVVLGGVEASLRRIAHYDYWSDRVRKSVLADSKADILLYGMADRTVVELAGRLARGEDWKTLRGLCYLAGRMPENTGFIELPSHEEAIADPKSLLRMHALLEEHSDPVTARGLIQRQDTRVLVHNPPALPLTPAELDAVHALPYERGAHPASGGTVRALDTIRFSLTTHRGCYGQCHFCSIAVHQGRAVVSRTVESVLREAAAIAALPGFKGYILDVGGPTANMYGIECARKSSQGACKHRKCLVPRVCPELGADHSRQIVLLEALRHVRGVKKVFVASGIRHDLVLADRRNGERYLSAIIRNHTGGQLKIAPEHVSAAVLEAMGKPGGGSLSAFKALFDRLNHGRDQFLTYYFIAAHPGCTARHMEELRDFTGRQLGLTPEQVQIFTPTPATVSALMYHTGLDPRTGQPLFVEKTHAGKQVQKDILTQRRDPRQTPSPVFQRPGRETPRNFDKRPAHARPRPKGPRKPPRRYP